MRQLLWKEFRERAIWFILWILCVVTLATLDIGGQGFSGIDQWTMLAAALALLAGLWGYSSELSGERATFLYSRALLWKQLLAAKLLTGLIVTVTAVVLGAVAYRLAAPEPYLPFLTPARLASDALWMAEITGSAYLVGLCCSMVLPGLAGGIITLLLYAGLFMLTSVVQEAIDYKISFPSFTFAGMLAAPLVALVVLARFGLTLSWWQRLTRYLLIVIPILAGGLLLNWLYCLLPLVQPNQAHTTDDREITVSPTGRFAVIRTQITNAPDRFSWVELRTGIHGSLPDCWNLHWLNEDSLMLTEDASRDGEMQSTLAYWTGSTFAVRRVADNGNEHISPDSTRLLLATSSTLDVLYLHSGKRQSLLALHSTTGTGNRLNPTIKLRLSQNCWWQDNHTIGYLHPITGRRTLVRVE